MLKERNPLHLDADETAIFSQQLKHVKAQAYDVIRKELKALSLIPVSTEGDPGADQIAYRSFDQVGIAKIVSDYAKDFPRVDIYGVEKFVPVKSLGDSYGYSIQEIRRAQLAGLKLDTRRALAARRAMDEKQDSIGWFGDADAGLKGLLTSEGTTEYIAANNAAGTSKTWANKTADEKLNDIIGIITAAPNSTNGKEIPDTLILPLPLYNDLAYTPYGDNRDKTLMRFILDNYPTITRIDWVSDLAAAGAGGTGRVLAYARDPMKLTLEIPVRFEQFPPQQSGLEYTIFCHQRTGGVILYYPMSVVFCDGLLAAS